MLARADRDQPGDDAHQRGLAGAVGADHADRLAGRTSSETSNRARNEP